MIGEYYYGTGRRKSAVARVFLKGGNFLPQRLGFDIISFLGGGQFFLHLIELQRVGGQLGLELIYALLLCTVLDSQVLLRVATI